MSRGSSSECWKFYHPVSPNKIRLELFAHRCVHLRKRQQLQNQATQGSSCYTCFFFFKDSSNWEILEAQTFSCSDIILLSFFPDIKPQQSLILIMFHSLLWMNWELFSLNGRTSIAAHWVVHILWIAFPFLPQSLKLSLSNRFFQLAANPTIRTLSFL